ncbi:MAG: 3-phosphoshikimate 1-carboxyvinyltransferase [bacterium]
MDLRLSISAPASKSATQRALFLSTLASGTSTLHGPLDCEDSRALADALRGLGVKIDQQSDRWIVSGDTLQAASATLYCSNAGTCIRFLAAASLLLPSSVTLDAGEQLRKRPLQDIADALRRAGMHVEFTDREGFAPLTITPGDSIRNEIELDASRTSQFLSGLLMVAPRLGGISIRTGKHLVSRPYVDLTLALMSAFGGPPVREHENVFFVPAGAYQACDMTIEGDWSAAAMILTAGWISGLKIDIPNLNSESVQGDRAIVLFLEELGRPRHHRFDLAICPDLITPLAVACAFAEHPSEIRNVAHARIKESDRIAATVQMLNAVGVAAEQLADGLLITPGGAFHPATVEDHGDHRVAMAAGVISLRIPGVKPTTPECVKKSYPNFWNVMEELRCSLR